MSRKILTSKSIALCAGFALLLLIYVWHVRLTAQRDSEVAAAELGKVVFNSYDLPTWTLKIPELGFEMNVPEFFKIKSALPLCYGHMGTDHSEESDVPATLSIGHYRCGDTGVKLEVVTYDSGAVPAVQCDGGVDCRVGTVAGHVAHFITKPIQLNEQTRRYFFEEAVSIHTPGMSYRISFRADESESKGRVLKQVLLYRKMLASFQPFPPVDERVLWSVPELGFSMMVPLAWVKSYNGLYSPTVYGPYANSDDRSFWGEHLGSINVGIMHFEVRAKAKRSSVTAKDFEDYWSQYGEDFVPAKNGALVDRHSEGVRYHVKSRTYSWHEVVTVKKADVYYEFEISGTGYYARRPLEKQMKIWEESFSTITFSEL